MDAGETCDDGNGINGDGCENDCTVLISEAICRTPGFWGTHGGTEKSKQNAPNITQAVLDAAGGITVCGQDVDSTDPIPSLGLESAIQGLCVSVKGVSQRQLYRQLVAARLNCIVSNGDGNNCDALVPFDLAGCDAACVAGDGADPDVVQGCIDQIDCWNNGGLYLADSNCDETGHGTGCNEPLCEDAVCAFDSYCCDVVWDGICAAEAADPLIVGDACNLGSDICVGNLPDDDCHERDLCDSLNPDLCFDPPGPASSSKMCKRANNDDCTIDSC